MPSQPELDALVEQYTSYARALALDIAKSLPRFVSREDLISVGMEGLVTAASRFDPTRGIQFTTFAYYRIRGAIFDHVRRLVANDPYSRSRASAAAAVDHVVESALAQRQRAVTDGPAEAADVLAGILETAATAFSVVDCVNALTSDATRSEVETDELAARNEAASVLRVALTKIPSKERTMIQSVYFEGHTIEEAGKSLGLSKSWASRLHARALSLIREEMPQFAE